MRVFALLVVSAFTVAAAMAGDAVREIDFTQVPTGATGEPFMQGGKDCKIGQQPGKDCTQIPQTLGDMTLLALEATTDEDRNLDPKKKWDRDVLVRKVYGNAHAVLPPEDVALIKERIGKVYGPAQVGATWPILDPTLK